MTADVIDLEAMAADIGMEGDPAAVIAAAEESNTCTLCDPPKPYKHREDVRKHFREKHGVQLPRKGQAPGAGTSRERAPKMPKVGPGKANLERRFAASLATIGLGVRMLCPVCGDTFIAGTEEMARGWSGVAAENESVRQVMEALSGGGAWGMAVMSTLTVLIPMAGHHGLVPGRVASALGGHDHLPGDGAEANGSGTVTMHPDGSVDVDGQHMSAEQVRQGLEAFGVPPDLLGATTVPSV